MSWWPLFGLAIRTPQVELRYLDDELLARIVHVAAAGIIDDERPMPFLTPWIREEPPAFQRTSMQWHWKNRAEVSAAAWTLPFAVIAGGEVVGTQEVASRHFAVARQVQTGSWLGLAAQGRGIGKEMRTAVLHLAFDGLGAEAAHTEAFADNPRSLGVTKALGYEPNGWWVHDREGAAAREERWVMTRERWLERRRDDITIEGLTDDVLDLLGLGSGERSSDA